MISAANDVIQSIYFRCVCIHFVTVCNVIWISFITKALGKFPIVLFFWHLLFSFITQLLYVYEYTVRLINIVVLNINLSLFIIQNIQKNDNNFWEWQYLSAALYWILLWTSRILFFHFFYFADEFINLEHWLKGQASIKKGLGMTYSICTVLLSDFLGSFSNSKAEIVISTKAISSNVAFDLWPNQLN